MARLVSRRSRRLTRTTVFNNAAAGYLGMQLGGVICVHTWVRRIRDDDAEFGRAIPT